jgi:hypothetical protein
VVSPLAMGPKGIAAAGSGPAEDGGEVKPSVPCRRFTACERTLHSMSEMLCRPISRTLFLTRYSSASLPDGSGC